MADNHGAPEVVTPSAIERLARWVCAFCAEDASDASLKQAQLLTLDTIGCGIAALREEAAGAVLATVGDMGGAAQSTIIGQGRKTSVVNAVLANGVLVRVLDLNDYVAGPNGEIGGHPSDNIPVALSVGEMCQSSGRDVLAAVVLGYELYGRLKDLLVRSGPWDGVSITGLVAPAMAGWLMRLNPHAMAQALALSAARSATPSVVRAGDISAAKSVANALVAQNGVQAALLAKHGLTGPLSIMEHPRGLGTVFARREAWPTVTAPLTTDSYILRSSMKAYPCLATGQSLVAAGLQMHRLVGGDIDRLMRIRVLLADLPTLRRQKDDPGRIRPTSREAADHSFNFLTAVSMLDGAFGLPQFENERWRDPKVVALMGRLEIETDAGWADRPSSGYPCAIVATDKAGREYRADVPYPPGVSNGGIDPAAVLEKFRSITAPYLAPGDQDQVIETAMTLGESASCDGLMTALAAISCAA